MSETYNTRDAITTVAQNYKAKFEVDEVPEYRVVKRIAKKYADGVTKGLVFADEVVVVPRAWDVYFPGGHSVRIDSEREMYRLGYMNPPPLVDMATGEEVPDTQNLSLKEQVLRNTRTRKGAMS